MIYFETELLCLNGKSADVGRKRRDETRTVPVQADRHIDFWFCDYSAPEGFRGAGKADCQ